MPSTNPVAQKAVSERPAPLDVTKPTEPAEKDRDVKRKLKAYEAVKALQAGHLPSNAQIDLLLRRAIEHQLVDPANLSLTTKAIQADVNDLLQTLRDLLRAKNEDELIQEFISETQAELRTSADKPHAKEDASTAAQHLRTVLGLVLQNAEFRKVFFDLGTVGRDVLATAITKVAEEKIRPTEEQLSAFDRETPAGQTTSTPIEDIKVGQLASRAQEGVHQAQGAKQEAQVTAGRQTHEGSEATRGQQVSEFAGQKTEQSKKIAGESAEKTKRTLKERYHGLRERLTGDDDSDKLRQHKNRARHFLDEHLPAERRDQFLWRLKKAVHESQQRDEYDEAVSSLLDLMDDYRGQATHLKAAGGDRTSDPIFQRSFEHLKIILARLSGRPLDGVIAAVDQLYDDARHDDALRAWWADIDAYVRKSLLEPGFIVDDDCAREGRALRDRSDAFFKDKYAAHKDRLFDEISHWLKGFSEDSLNARLGSDVRQLAKDLLFDESGAFTVKTEVWDDLRKLVLPAAINRAGYIPIPRIDYSDKQVDISVEGLVIRAETLFPNFIDIESHQHIRFSPTQPSAVGPGATYGRLTVRLEQLQADIRDCHVAFAKKAGFPKLRDAGLVDCLIGGEGISATIVLETAPATSQSVFVVKDVKAHVGTLKVATREMHHTFIYQVLFPLISGLIKRKIARSIEQSIRTALQYADTQLATVRREVKEANSEPGMKKVDAFSGLVAKKKAQGEEAKAKTEAKGDELQSRVSVGPPLELSPSAATTVVSSGTASQGWKSSAFDFL